MDGVRADVELVKVRGEEAKEEGVRRGRVKVTAERGGEEEKQNVGEICGNEH